MRYFIMEQTNNYMPQIILPYSIKQKIDIKSGEKNIDENVNIWKVKGNKFTLYPDILIKPLLLLRQGAKNILQMYEQKTIFRQVILFDKENEVTMQYYFPLLPEINIKQRKRDEVSLSKEDFLTIKRASLLKMREGKKIYYVANLEIIESFLKKGLTGIEIESIKFLDKEID